MNKLPNKFEKNNQLKNMHVGQSGYIVPWGMWVDIDGNCWLNESYDFHPYPDGTVQLKITKEEHGYVAHIYEMEDDYKWENRRESGFMTPDDECYGAVIGFGINPAERFPIRKFKDWFKFRLSDYPHIVYQSNKHLNIN